ncbi:MAG: sigma-54 dependent transcriptional regulator [Acidobacteriota bacterium]|jgi:two-component system nitrogen regulation response regulator NtrX|nr:sigma-54 dependent transcriptional regulator [Acidobacteriota bacterium]
MIPASVLVVDDEKGVRNSVRGILEDAGYVVEAAPSGEDALELLRKTEFPVVLLDVWLPGIDGLETLARMRHLAPESVIIMISGHGSIETAVRATRLGAFDFIEKPLSLEKTLLVVGNAVQQHRLQQENLRLRRELEQQHVMIGDSVPMQALRQQIAFAAPTAGRVLIRGENGTGKELVAHLLHQGSLRREGAFVEMNCAAIPEELVESELFGHVKGSFTGAAEDKEGKFAQADGGTLFLDEIGDMSPKTQAKMLRVLEEQRFSPVGSNASIKVDVRVIASTNKDLEGEIEAGNFREDLYYRLNVLPFQIPPLRERAEDIPLLTAHFLEGFSRRYGRKPPNLTRKAKEALESYPWPGNVRELRNLMERIVIMTKRPRIDIYDLPEAILHHTVAAPEAAGDADGSACGETSLHAAREQFEREFILRKLIECKGNICRAAEALQVERSNLYRKIKQLGIPHSGRENGEDA